MGSVAEVVLTAWDSAEVTDPIRHRETAITTPTDTAMLAGFLAQEMQP